MPVVSHLTRHVKIGCSTSASLFFVAFCAITGVAQTTASSDHDHSHAGNNRVVKRGLTAEFHFSHSSGSLRALDDQSIDSPVLVRLEKALPSSQPIADQDTAANRYTLWFFGAVAGDYNLADFVVQEDGSALAAAEMLADMNVRVVSELPPGRGTSLYEIDDPALRLRGGYRAALITLGALWFAVPFVWAVWRWRNQTEPVDEIVIQPPTLADRIRPLVQRAYEGKLSVQEQSRLEFALYKFWQRRVRLPESISTALPVLRQHAEAGDLLRKFEAWVHAPDDSRPELDSETLDKLLLPYRDAEEQTASFDDVPNRDHDVLMEAAS